MIEQWKSIPEYEGVYEISNLGNLKSYKKEKAGRILKQTNSKGGYFSVVLEVRGKRKRYTRLHILVAEAFVPNPDNMPEVNHMDFDKQNTRADNLEWVTRKENMVHARKHNPNIVKGMVNYNQKIRPVPLMQFSLDGSFIGYHQNGAEASNESGVCQRNILQVASSTEYKPGLKRIQAGGYNWCFMTLIDIDMDLSYADKINNEFIKRKQLCLAKRRRNAAHRSGVQLKQHEKENRF